MRINAGALCARFFFLPLAHALWCDEADSAPLPPHPHQGAADSLEAFLGQLGESGGENEAELHGLLETMMSQLMSKEVLYEPLKELHEKVSRLLADYL